MLPACNELLGGGQRRNTNLIAVNDCNALGVNNAACIANSGVRRKSLSFQTSQQLAIKSNGDDAVTIESSAGRFSPHPNDIFSAQAAKLTIPLEKFDDLLVNSGCLPPPSPAPHSDSHMEMQTKLNSSNNQMQQLNLNQFQHHAHNHNHAHTHTHTQVFPLSSSNSASSLCTNNSSSTQAENTSSAEKHNKFMPHPRAISPNSKYRLERYREQTRPPSSNASSSNSTRYYMTSPKMVQCDAYGGYLGSTVHTPVKRYVPTPPPVDLIAAAASPTCTLSSSQYVNIPYGNYTRGKCTHEESQGPGAGPAIYSKSAQTYNIINMPSSSAAGTGTGTVQSLSCPCPFPSLSPAPIVSFSAPSTAASSSSTLVGRSATKINSYRSGTHSIEGSTAGIQRQYDEAAEPIILIQSESSQRQGTGQTAENSSTCLHCNTARRTTGVHQTTQTTGPISPVPAMTLTIPMKQQHEQQELMIALSPPATIELTSQQQQQQQQLQQATKLYSASNLSNLQIKTNHLQQQQQQQYQLQHQQQQQQQHQQQLQQQSLQTLSQQQQVQVQLQVQPQQQQQQQSHRYSCKKRIIIYLRREISRFFGVEPCTEAADFALWYERHRRLAIRCFGPFNSNSDNTEFSNNATMPTDNHNLCGEASGNFYATDRPDILPAQDAQIVNMEHFVNKLNNNSFNAGEFVERKATVVHMLMTTISYLINIFHKRPKCFYNNGNILKRRQRQWSRSFAPLHVQTDNGTEQQLDSDCSSIGIADSIAALIDGEVFFDNPCIEATNISDENTKQASASVNLGLGVGVASEATVGVYLTERHQGWRTSALHLLGDAHGTHHQANLHTHIVNVSRQSQNVQRTVHNSNSTANRGTRIVAQLLDGVLENSRRPQMRRIKYFSSTDLDDRTDHRPFFTYWINTVQIIVLFLSIICYGIAPIGFGTEQKTGQVLVTSLSLQTVQHVEQRNLWIGPRNNDLVHMGAKFAACMRRDVKIMEVVTKTRRQERETACCIRNDDSGCVQSSQADCSIRGLYPTKSISTWKKWSPGESGPGGRISGSVCGLDPKFCDAPASIVPYEWPDDITKWPICRKTNSFSQRYRYKDHTAEHMVCEVIGHPCCTGLYGECRITTREYCDFVNGYFHEEASLCSQISCLNNVCGMFPFISVEIPDQIYRLLTSLCMHAGILHLAITLIFQHLFLADLERLIGTCRTAVVYIMSGLIGNLTSAVLVPHRAEVGPSASLCGVVSSLVALLIWMHWKHLHKPYVALLKLLLLSTVLFAIGTLPYQLNFAGLLAGVACGAFLTISLVPFASFSKYGRRKKINLIWMCIVFHLFVYATLIATFYIYPSEFGTFNFVDDVFGSNGNGKGFTSATNSNIGHYNGDVSSTTRRYSQTQKPQFYYHHHSEDIIRNTGAFTEENIISHIYPEAQRQKNVQLWQNDFYTRSHSYNSSSYSENIFKNKEKMSKTNFLASDRKRNSKSNIAEVNYKSSANMNNTKFKGL